eukprot:3700652-Karenia_brevis.AAC.1
MSYDIGWSPQGVDEMSVAMSYDMVTLKEVVRKTALTTSLPSHTDIAMPSRLTGHIPHRSGNGNQ